VVWLPLQLVGFLEGSLIGWVLVSVFQLTLGLWLLMKGVKGVATPTLSQSA
jgi:hypothetical protein